MTALRVRTVALDPAAWATHPVRRAADVVFERDGRGLAARGVALRVPAPAAAATLAAIDVDDEVQLPGTGPVAFGALPFHDCGAGEVLIPTQLVGLDAAGHGWQTEVIGAETMASRCWGPEPDGFTLRSAVPQEAFERAVAIAVERIGRGEVRKVVLAREVSVEADREIVLPTVVRRLRALFPACTTFLVDGFVGASPELLVRRRGAELVCHPLAGTRPRSGDPDDDRRVGESLLASAKERTEHRLVVEAIAEVLRPLCAELDAPSSPSIVQLRNVTHLATRMVGRLAAPLPTVLELVAALHPTPAVGGAPTGAALRLIAELEPLAGRGLYGGPVGWMDSRGDGEFVVGIRAASVDGARASMWAGVGIVAGSTPESELAETQFKLQAMLAAIVRP